MRFNAIERLAVFLWLVIPVGMMYSFTGTQAEYVIVGVYLCAIGVSITDIFVANKILTACAFGCWAGFFFIGRTLEYPQDYSFIASTILGLEGPIYGTGTILSGIAILSAIVLLVSLGEEILFEDNKK